MRTFQLSVAYRLSRSMEAPERPLSSLPVEEMGLRELLLSHRVEA